MVVTVLCSYGDVVAPVLVVYDTWALWWWRWRVVEVAGGVVSASSQTTLQMIINKVYIYETKIYLGLVVCDGSS